MLLDDPADRPAAIRRAERILAIAETPYDLDGHPVAVTGSIGIAVAVADDNRGGGPALLRRADAAMYIAKAAGKAAGTPSTVI